MAKYVCSVCGYVHDESVLGDFNKLPADYKCPICKADKSAFVLEKETQERSVNIEKPTFNKELSPKELSAICSNLARGCEKQYDEKSMQAFKDLAQFFDSKSSAKKADDNLDKIVELVNQDLNKNFVYADDVAKNLSDRGALRALTWSKKVTTILNSLLEEYKVKGEKMLENTNVFVCTICGFIYVGDTAPDLCPVCKVPPFKFEKIGG